MALCVKLCNVYTAAPYLQNTRQSNLSHQPIFRDCAANSPDLPFSYHRPSTTKPTAE